MTATSYVARYRHFGAARLLAVTATLGLALTGCAQFPELSKELEMKPAAHYESSQSFAAKPAAWPQEQWWMAYGDSQLDRLMTEGLQGSPNLANAQARLRQAEAMRRVAGAAQQPQVSASASATEQKQSYNYLFPRASVPQGWTDYGQATLDFSWEFDFWGKNHAALAAALSMQEASAADAAQASLTLTTSIATAYAELARLFAAQDTAQTAVDVRSKSAALFQKRYENGMETLGAVRQADARKAAAEQESLALDEQIGLQRNRIAALLGAGPDRGLTITRPKIDVAKGFGLPSSLQLELLGRRPDVVAARLRAQAAEHSVEKQKAEFYPNVNLAGFIGLQSLGLSKLTNSGSDFGSIGPAISLPIFNGGRLQGQLLGTHAEYDIAVASYNATVTQAMQEVADVAVSQKSHALQLAKAEEGVAAAREAYRVLKNRYEGGLANYLEVLSVEEALLGSVRTLTDMQSRGFTLDIALIKALGGGYENKGMNK